MKKILLIFVTAFVFNAIWENLHSVLYDNYMGGKITEFILLRATLADAMMIAIITLPFVLVLSFKKYDWLIIIIGFIVAVSIEWSALATGRWTYNAYMPIIPLLSVGLTPAIQLGLLGLLSFKIQEKFDKAR